MKQIKIVVAAIVLIYVMIVPSVISSAASCGETVRQNTEEVLKSVDYANSDQIAALLAPTRYTMADMLNKKTEIAKRDGRNFVDITDDEAKRELDRENVKVMSFDESFAKVQGQIGEIVQKVVDNTSGAESKGASFYTEKIVQNKEKLLLGIAYIKRLYDFNMGEKNICDVLLYEPDTYGSQTDVVDWLIKIGGAGGDTLKISNSAKVFGYGKLFFDVTGYSATNLGAFLELNRQKWIPGESLDKWFLSASHAYIVEELSSWDTSANKSLYSRLYNTSQSHILPLLTVSEDSLYVIATTSTITYGIVDCYVDRNLKETNPALYGERREQFRRDLEQAARQQREFIDVWYRLAKPEVRGNLSSNRIVKDSLRLYSDVTVSAQSEWSAKFGSDAASGVREFFAPLNLYDTYNFMDGMADGDGIRYYLSKALTERGLATYAHELTHLLVSKMMLGGYSARDGMLAEVYTRGMFEPYELNDPPAFNLNLIYDRQTNGERLHNAVPGRFLDETDMQEYMSGILDVVYTLDYAEAEVILAKTPGEKKKWFHKLEQIEDTEVRTNQGEDGSVHRLDSVRELTLDEVEGLNTIDDLIRNNIIVSRYEVNGTTTTGTMAKNGYYVVPLFSANYAGVQNDYGVSGDMMIRRQAFELLAEYGYYGGMVPYISNQYKEAAKAENTLLSDTYILKKISGGAYSTMTDFKKDMFRKRIEKVGELKPVTISWRDQSVRIRDFQTLQQLMKEAVESDLVNVSAMPGGANNIRAQKTQVELLKAEIFRAYLFQTDDFRESIYGEGEEPEEPTVAPTVEPTVAPTVEPTVEPTVAPTVEPTVAPTEEPTVAPTEEPTVIPTVEPTVIPTVIPTVEPTVAPTVEPTVAPTVEPTEEPTVIPTVTPTAEPMESLVPGVLPTAFPVILPTVSPTPAPIIGPTLPPEMPTGTPISSIMPTVSPTPAPIVGPTLPPEMPTGTPIPSIMPTVSPTPAPTAEPAPTPTVKPTILPTTNPVAAPSVTPTAEPATTPTVKPTILPITNPTAAPSVTPTAEPMESPISVISSTEVPTEAPEDFLKDERDDDISDDQVVGKSKLLFVRVSSSKKSQTIRWNSVSGADGYYIYGAKSTAKYKRLKIVSKKVSKWKHKGLKAGIQYKYRVAAYKIVDGKRVIISRSLPVYSTTKGGKYGNPSKLRVKKASVSVKLGKKARLNVEVTGKGLNKAGRKIRYVLTDPSVMKVSKKGVITGVKRGTCYVYYVARNGLFKKIRVSVK